MTSLTIRKPTMKEVPGIHALIEQGSASGALLSHSLPELYTTVREFYICMADEQVVGCAGLHIDMPDLAEVRSVIVSEAFRGKKIGEQLVQACIAEARELCIPRIYALTRVDGFFSRLGFYKIDMHVLPQKVFRDCVRCPLFPDCDEIAMMYDVLPENKTGSH